MERNLADLDNPNDRMFTTVEFADFVRRAPESIRRWRQADQGPDHVKVHGQVLYPWSWVCKWQAAESARNHTKRATESRPPEPKTARAGRAA